MERAHFASTNWSSLLFWCTRLSSRRCSFTNSLPSVPRPQLLSISRKTDKSTRCSSWFSRGTCEIRQEVRNCLIIIDFAQNFLWQGKVMRWHGANFTVEERARLKAANILCLRRSIVQVQRGKVITLCFYGRSLMMYEQCESVNQDLAEDTSLIWRSLIQSWLSIIPKQNELLRLCYCRSFDGSRWHCTDP